MIGENGQTKAGNTTMPQDDLGIMWCEGELIIVGARPAVGKTAFAVQSCFSAARRGYAPAVFFTLGCSCWHTRKLFLLHQMGMTGWLSSEQDLIRMPEIPVYLEDFDRPPFEQLVDRIVYYAKEKKAKLFVIDYIQMLDDRAIEPYGNREIALEKVLTLLKALAETLSVIIYVNSSLSRKWVNAGVPSIIDLLDICDAEEYCNQILLLHDPSMFGLEDFNGNLHKKIIYIAKGYCDHDEDENEINEIEVHYDFEKLLFTRLRPWPEGLEAPDDLPADF